MKLMHANVMAATVALFAVLSQGQTSGDQPSPATDMKLGASTAATVVPLHGSATIDSPWRVKRVAVTSADIADVQVLSPQQVLVQGKAIGSTDVILWGENGETWKTRVDVDADLTRMKEELARLFAGSSIELRQSQNVIVATGTLSRAEQVDELHKFFAAAGIKLVDATTLAGIQQVQIRVRVAEVSRVAIRALGINAFATGNDFFGASTIAPDNGTGLTNLNIGPPKGALAGSNVPFTFNNDLAVSPAVTLFGGVQDANLEFFLQALAENQYLRILAEPNLVALSGEEASFLAGGEIPIPVSQGSTTGGIAITIEWKEFGVRLKFKPTVLGDGTIRLHVAPEVSELSPSNAVELQGFFVPSIVTRKSETTLELKSEQTFAMAGLMQHQTTARNSRVPCLGDMPVLGALFRSVRYDDSDTELVVLVKASLIEPMSVAHTPPTPGVMHVTPNDWELYALGRIDGKALPRVSAVDAQWLDEMGLPKLKGPGAWVTYDTAVAHGQGQAPTTQPDFDVPAGSEKK